MKSKNKKQSSIYIITLFGILLTTFLIYSCSTDEYNYTNETATEVTQLPKHAAWSLKLGIQEMY